jgi:CarboxypepD_reg-like domain
MLLQLKILLGLLLFSSATFAQEKRSISGTVRDAVTKEPIPFVNVFFANTTIGTSTATDGSFIVSEIPVGKYDLVVSTVGYLPFSQQVNFSDLISNYTKELKINIELTQETKVLSEVIVKADTVNWARNFEQFKRLFLGETRLSKKCKILNPKAIHFFLDSKDGVLVAHANQPIEIENNGLGYKIYYYLYQFEYHYNNGALYVFGLPRYEEIESTKSGDQKKWKKEREKAYRGSVMHFMRSLRENSIKANKFTIRKIYTINNRKRPSDSLINKKIQALKKNNKTLVIDYSTNPKDSLSYFLRLKSQPKEVDSIASQFYSGREFWNESTSNFENIKGKYEVVYDEKEEVEYLRTVSRDITMKQKSVFQLLTDSLKIYNNGYYEDVRSLFIEGYLSWHEKLSTLLPLEYSPQTSDNERD